MALLEDLTNNRSLKLSLSPSEDDFRFLRRPKHQEENYINGGDFHTHFIIVLHYGIKDIDQRGKILNNTSQICA